MSLNHIVTGNNSPLNVEVNDLKIDGTLQVAELKIDNVDVDDLKVNDTFTFDGFTQYSRPGISLTPFSTIPPAIFDMITGGAATQNYMHKFAMLKRYRLGAPSDGQYCVFEGTFEYQPASGYSWARAQLNIGAFGYPADMLVHNSTYKLIATINTLVNQTTAVVQDANTIYIEFVPNANNIPYQFRFEWWSTAPYTW